LHRLYDADLVGNVQGIVVARQAHIGLLLAIGADEHVDLGHLDVVELAHCGTHVVLVGAQVCEEDQGVVVLDLLHGRLGGQRVLDDVVGVHAVPGGHRLPGVLGTPGQLQGGGPTEVHVGADLAGAGAEGALDDLMDWEKKG